MKNNRYLLALASLLTLSAVTYSTGIVAAEVDANTEEEKSPWTSSVELGFIRTTGNTETQTLAGKADVVYEVDKWRHSGRAEGYGAEAVNQNTGENVVSAERYELLGKSDYKFTEDDYAFALLRLRKDRFSGFEYDHLASVGYGRKAIKQDNMELDLEIGPGARFFKIDPTLETPNPESESEAVLRLAAKYWWQITGSSKFTQLLSADFGEETTTSESVTGIQANINKTLALKFTYTVRHRTKVPADNEKTDTETAMTLVYTF